MQHTRHFHYWILFTISLSVSLSVPFRYQQIADSLEPTSSESEGTTEEEPPQPQPSELTSQVYDYVELAQSGSSLSTPPCPDQPFAADDLGDTVIRRDRALAKLVSGEEEGSPALQPPVVSPGPLVNEEGVLETSFEQEPPVRMDCCYLRWWCYIWYHCKCVCVCVVGVVL